jgi:DNA primase
MHDLEADEGRRAFLNEMLEVASQIPEATDRDQFADRIAHRARVTEDVVRSEIRKAAVERRTVLTARELPSFGQVKQAEKGLIWAVFHDTEAALEALGGLEDEDVRGLATVAILEIARTLRETPVQVVPAGLLARLNTLEAQLVAGIAAEARPVAPAVDCARALRRMRFERERAGLQREIDRLQEAGSNAGGGAIEALMRRKIDLSQQIETLT